MTNEFAFVFCCPLQNITYIRLSIPASVPNSFHRAILFLGRMASFKFKFPTKKRNIAYADAAKLYAVALNY